MSVTLTNPQNTPEPDGATLAIESDSNQGTLYSYSKTTQFTGTDEENAAEITANGVGQAPVVGTNTRVVTGQDPLTPHYAGWVQDPDAQAAPPTGDNLLVWTEDFEQTEWNLNKSVVTSTGQVGPTSSNASLITDDGVSAAGVVEVQQQTFSLPAGTYTCSVSAKAGKCSSLVIDTANSATGDGETRFNLETGEVTAAHPDHFDHGMVSEANDYWRCYISITTTQAKNVKWAFRGSKDTSDWLTPDGSWDYSITQAQVNTGALAGYLKVEAA